VLLVKLSILALYKRIFPGRPWRIASLVLGVVFVLFYVAGASAVILQCDPIQATWRLELEARCFDIMKVQYISGAFNIITDIGLCVAPILSFRKLHLPKRQKMVLYVLFLGGGL
jgi:hypothetical protein